MKAATLVALALVAALAGCFDPAETTDPEGPDGGGDGLTTMSIVGLVLDETLAPIAGANVSVRLTELAATTDAAGHFQFKDIARSAYSVDVQANGYENSTLTAEPEETASLEFILPIQASLQPRNVTLVYHGTLECAFEAFIISPSCDSAVADPPVDGPGVFDSVSIFDQPLEQRWVTVVVDVEFDPDANPGLDGLRLVVRGPADAQALGTYEKYGTFIGQDDFTAHLAPGQSYDGGDVPVEANAAALELQILPQSHGYHAGGVSPFLGVGVGTNVAFDVYVTIFYNEPAATGWTFLNQTPA